MLSLVSWSLHACRALVFVLLAGTTAWAAPKIDVVVLENGDRITCEIKSLSRGRLSLGTDALDTIRVYWNRVVELRSPRAYQIEVEGGQRYFGSLAPGGPRRLRIERAAAPATEIGLDEIVRIAPIEATIWQQMDGHIDTGVNFAKANRETRLTLNADNTFRNRRYESRMTLASQITRRDDAEQLQRNSASVTGNRLLGPHWSALLIGQYQQNEELSLEYRTLAGGGVGRYFVQSNQVVFQAYSGVAWTRERFTDDTAQDRAEAVIGANLDWFSARNDHVDLSSSAVTFYSLNGDSRFRLETQTALRVEFLKDFYVSFNGYSSVDSRPPSGQEKADFGLSLTLGWSY